MSMSAEVTFMPGRYCSSNSSQYGLDSGVCWRLILKITVLEFAIFAFTLFALRSSLFGFGFWLLAVSRQQPAVQQIPKYESRLNNLNLETRNWTRPLAPSSCLYVAASYRRGRGLI